MLRLLNKEIIGSEASEVGFVGMTAICFCFDLYQWFCSAHQILALLSGLSLVLGLAGFFNLMGRCWLFYIGAYLIPTFCLIVSRIPGVQFLGINPGDFELSAYVTVGTALMPPIARLVVGPIATLAGACTKWLEK